MNPATKITMSPRRIARRNVCRVLLGAAYLALACRLLVPAGYMPSAIGEGGPISLCPTGLPAGFLPETAEHHHHDDYKGAERLWEPCLLGAAADTALAVEPVHFEALSLEQAALPAYAARAHHPRRALGFRSRAPPLLVA